MYVFYIEISNKLCISNVNCRKKATDHAAMLRQMVNRYEKNVQENLHKVCPEIILVINFVHFYDLFDNVFSYKRRQCLLNGKS